MNNAKKSRSVLIDALDGRSAFYDFLAAIYYKPLGLEEIENIANLDLSAYADVNDLFADGLCDMSRSLQKRNTGTRQALAVDFTAAFAGTSSWKGKYAVPYESVFTSDEGLMFQDAYHEVYNLYRENDMRKNDGFDFPDDHLSFMCGFMSMLSRRASDALKEGNAALACNQLSISRDFLEDHIISWFPQFSELALLLLKTRFYRGVLKMTAGFFAFDREVLDDSIAELQI